MQTMLVFFHELEPLTASWVLLNEENQIISSVENSPFIAPDKDTDVVLFVPAEHVVLTEAQVPSMSKQRLLQALPFALEEQLLEDVENLHFAAGEPKDDVIPVAVVSKNKMEMWLNVLKNFNINPSVITSILFTLPFAEKTIYVNTNSICNIRVGKYTGYCLDKDNLQMALDTLLSHHPDTQVERMKSSELALMEHFSKSYSNQTFINLLQGPYKPKQRATQTKKIWITASYLFAGFVGLLLFKNTISFFILHHEENKIETAIAKIYKHYFPNATTVTAPRQRMEEKLKSAYADANHNNFLVLLSLISKSSTESPGISIKNLEYHDQLLSLDVSAGSFDQLDVFTAALEQKGLTAKRQNAGTVGNQIKATLSISTAGAA